MKGRKSTGGGIGKEEVLPRTFGEEKKDEADKERKRGGRMMHEPHGEKHRGHKKVEHERKHGGMVHGKHPGHRLDKRARGGRMSEPYSEAGKMAAESYEKGHARNDDQGGKGKDRD